MSEAIFKNATHYNQKTNLVYEFTLQFSFAKLLFLCVLSFISVQCVQSYRSSFCRQIILNSLKILKSLKISILNSKNNFVTPNFFHNYTIVKMEKL